MQRPGGRPELDLALVIRLDETGRIPTPTEQVENLLLWLGNNLAVAGEQVELHDESHGGIIGTANPENFIWLLDHLLSEGVLLGRPVLGGRMIVMPSFKGWVQIGEIQRGHGEAKRAFMAMPYGNGTLDDVVLECFRPAVEATGFRLERLDEAPKAGLIDDRLRVEIRTSRFLLADLTHGNQGAYWEAGFAEGLGKPVIYTCEKTVFEQEKTHFDTNHHLTVPWSKNDLGDAAERLKATIRATLPDEAKHTDA